MGRTAEIYPWGEKQVVKLFRPGMSPGMAEKEAATGRIVAEAGVGAPPVGDVVTVEGRPGIVYGRIDGAVDAAAAAAAALDGMGAGAHAGAAAREDARRGAAGSCRRCGTICSAISDGRRS